MADLLESIKTAAMKAFENSQPTAVMYGEVISVSPLKILVEQKLTLGISQLVLTRNVTEFTVDATVNWSTDSQSVTLPGVRTTLQNGGEPQHTHIAASSYTGNETNHNHSVSGRKSITIHNGLILGDIVLLIRQTGGQKFIVIDRVVN